ncbi:unnamed protein product, partial [Callosobruchus maculatus]
MSIKTTLRSFLLTCGMERKITSGPPKCPHPCFTPFHFHRNTPPLLTQPHSLSLSGVSSPSSYSPPHSTLYTLLTDYPAEWRISTCKIAFLGNGHVADPRYQFRRFHRSRNVMLGRHELLSSVRRPPLLNPHPQHPPVRGQVFLPGDDQQRRSGDYGNHLAVFGGPGEHQQVHCQRGALVHATPSCLRAASDARR